MLDIKRLHYPKTVYRHKNLTKASEILFVSQPAISTAISSPEAELGVKLMMRSSKGVIFTGEGEEFMQRVTKIIALCQEAEEVMKDFSESAEQHLRLGMSTSISHSLIPLIFRQFIPEHPRAKLHLIEGTMKSHLSMIRNENLNLAYNAIPDTYDSAELSVIPMGHSEIYAVLHPEYPLAKLERIPVELPDHKDIIMMNNQSKVASYMLEIISSTTFTLTLSFLMIRLSAWPRLFVPVTTSASSA